MKQIFHLDQNYEQLKQLDFFSPTLPQFSFKMIRKYAQTIICINHNNNNFKDITKLLTKQNKCSVQSLKNLIFFNTIIHQNLKLENLELENIVTQEINKIIVLENKRQEHIVLDKNRKKGFSIDKATNWVRQTFSRSKQKDTRLNRTISQNNNSNLRNRIAQNTFNGQTPTNKQQNAQLMSVKNKQQLLVPKIIIPYATYLLRLNSCQTNLQKIIPSSNLKTQQIWKIINLMKYLLKITHCFPMLIRYFNQYYEIIVRSIIKVIDFELKKLYPFAKIALNTKLELIKKQTVGIYEKCQNQRKKIMLLQQIVCKFQLDQFKRMVEEIGIINQQILSIYYGKLTYYMVKAMSLIQPDLLAQNGYHFDLVYDVLKQVQKNKSQAKKLSNSKQKRTFIIQLPLKSTKIKQTFIPQKLPAKPIFAQKKLKILTTDSNKTTTIPATTPASKQQLPKPSPQNQISTFRKMRLNMTSNNNNLQQSNTRRLRL